MRERAGAVTHALQFVFAQSANRRPYVVGRCGGLGRVGKNAGKAAERRGGAPEEIRQDGTKLLKGSCCADHPAIIGINPLLRKAPLVPDEVWE